MKCPNDNTTLVMSDRNGIEIDYCPECRGVWLDRGELDKIIERSLFTSQPQANYQAPVSQNYPQDNRRHHDYDNDYNQGQHKKRRKESFLGDLFDF